MVYRLHRFVLWLMFWTGIASLLIGLGLPFVPLGGSHAQDDPEDAPPPLVELNEDVIKRATVFVMQTYQVQNETIISCVGSGTLVSADGLILTNAHNAVPSATCRSDELVIAITVRLDEPPIPTYTAEVVDASQGLDLAVLRINGYLDGRVIEPDSLQLPFVELGDSNAVQLDDTLAVVGYPDFGKRPDSPADFNNEPVAVERVTVDGFTAEARTGDRAWLRTGLTIPGTMSGGGAYNREGKLVGIPTIAPAGGVTVDCRVIQDTNLDGRADRNDDCVPVGGLISALRPSRLARGLVRAATLGIRQGESRTPSNPLRPEGSADFSRLFFSTSINEAGVPTNIVASGVPSGTTSLYLFFDYDNMVDGMVYELKVTVDDVPNPTYSLPPVTWSGGQRGMWYIGSAGIPWRNGLYFFRLFIEGHETASASMIIGGGPRNDPAFSDIVFGVLDVDENLVGTSYVLPEGSGIQARFSYRNMQRETSWGYIWYYERQEIYRQIVPWDGEVQGTRIITAQADFLPGEYRLELYINNTLSATADFVVAGGAELSRSVIFTELKATTGISDDAPLEEAVRTDFPPDIPQLYIFFNWRLIAPGTMWTYRWLIDGDVLFEVTTPWRAAQDGENYYLSLDSLGALPDGTYKLEIRMANILLAAIETKIGLGQLPIGAFASADDAMMTGRITDAETGAGIPGAMFIVLEAEYSIEDFLWQQSQVLGLSLADGQGRFQIPVSRPRDVETDQILYSVLVRAEGYLPLSADGIPVTRRTESPVVIDVELTPH